MDAIGAIEAIMTTRAIRRYTDEPVSDDDVLTCLRAAQQAPTGGNVQPVQYVVVTEPDRRSRLAHWYRTAFDRYEVALPEPSAFKRPEDADSWRRSRHSSRHLADHLGDAPVIVLFLLPIIEWTPRDAQGDMDIGPLYASAYPAVQNFCVAARALGIGTALTTVVRIHTAEVFTDLGIPAGYEIVALVPMGRPAGNFGVAYRKPVEAVTHWNEWGSKRR